MDLGAAERRDVARRAVLFRPKGISCASAREGKEDLTSSGCKAATMSVSVKTVPQVLEWPLDSNQVARPSYLS